MVTMAVATTLIAARYSDVRIFGAWYDVPEVTALQIQKMQLDTNWHDGLVLVDVRDVAETDVSMIPGAIIQAEFERNIDQHRGKKIITYCTIGHRSGRYARKLVAQGFRASNYRGSILDWCQHGFTVVTPDGQPTVRVHTYSGWYTVARGYQAIY